MGTRLERDSMGQISVPADALYGASTARAVENFPISGGGIGRDMIRALALVKLAASRINVLFGKLDKRLGLAIEQAAREVELGEHDAHFPVDVFQTGSGTSSNMNINEVIANRALLLLGEELGSRFVHPNDHVNMGQSSNDVFPTALHIAALDALEQEFYPGLDELVLALDNKAESFEHIVKIARTHLMDATPIRLGQVFSGYASQVRHGVRHVRMASEDLRELPIGGTAVGTGMGTFEGFGARMVEELSALTGLRLKEAENHFEAQGARDAVVRMSGALKSMALSLAKIASDIRLLGSGPRLGFGELILPPVQPGSSMMPGKVNPVIAEALIQVAVQVVGDDAAISAASGYTQLELAAVQPVMARNLMEQIHLLGRVAALFTNKLVMGLRADEGRIAQQLENSLGLATALAPHIGYDRAADIAQEAARTGRTVRQVAMDEKALAEDQLDRLFDPKVQTKPSSILSPGQSDSVLGWTNYAGNSET